MAGGRSGSSVASAGDVNADGFADLIIGAPTGRGASYVVFGHMPDVAVNRTGTDASQTLAGGAFDDTLRGLGGNDALFGNQGADTLKGGGGEDMIKGGIARDRLEGGAGDDLLIGGRNGDVLVGGEGHDTFAYESAEDSTSRGYDTIIGFDAGSDLFDLPVTVAGMDPPVTSGRLSEANFNVDLAAAADASTLLAHHAAVFRPDTGAHAGETFLIVDANGVAGYQAREDFVFRLANPDNLGALSTEQFV